MDACIPINRPPRDGRMAFVRSPDRQSIEPLHKRDALPPREPWEIDAGHREVVRTGDFPSVIPP